LVWLQAKIEDNFYKSNCHFRGNDKTQISNTKQIPNFIVQNQ